MFFLPNLVLLLFGTIPYASQTWSIGAEEQFYIVWPLLNKKIKNKLKLTFSIIIIYLLVRTVLFYVFSESNFWYKLWVTMPLHYMAVGGVFAVIVESKSLWLTRLRQIIFNRIFLILCTFLFFVSYVLNVTYYLFTKELFAVLYGVFIASQACNSKCLVRLDNRMFQYLGKLSYGIYMYHAIAIVLAIQFSDNYLNRSPLFVMLATWLLTLLFSTISYHYFEGPFLKLKRKFAVVKSGH
jgi:peptidoglycan/LPS O-acetylase OafA/YrhL